MCAMISSGSWNVMVPDSSIVSTRPNPWPVGRRCTGRRARPRGVPGQKKGLRTGLTRQEILLESPTGVALGGANKAPASSPFRVGRRSSPSLHSGPRAISPHGEPLREHRRRVGGMRRGQRPTGAGERPRCPCGSSMPVSYRGSSRWSRAEAHIAHRKARPYGVMNSRLLNAHQHTPLLFHANWLDPNFKVNPFY